mmetsp:Transcript_40136/g.78420  ORF Transcript_40136/g.78420 Transcript_40136/m.78420 type:complete len:230 (+) Transcript_40136:121-810(+)
MISEVRERMYDMARENAVRKRRIRSFVGAVETIKTRIEHKAAATAAAGEEGGGEEELEDHEATIRALMAEDDSGAVNDDNENEALRRIKEKLGEKDSAPTRNGGNDSDDDIEEMANQAGESEQSFKCPITTALFEDPVRNPACGHTYSRAGIDMLFKSARGRQPVACPNYGCSNKDVKRADLTEDREMVMRVRRFIKRREYEAQHGTGEEYEDVDEDDTGEVFHGPTRL